jgi:hypothetical protein
LSHVREDEERGIQYAMSFVLFATVVVLGVVVVAAMIFLLAQHWL